MVKGQRSKIKDESDPTPKPEVRNIIAACAAAVDELAASRELVDALEKENEALRSRLETEKQLTELLTELNNTRKSEADALRAAVTAKSDALDAKDAVIASQDKLIKALEKKKSSPWRRLGDVLIGAAVIAVMK
jgi:septal ring factor EnvC (AmiA/AmiB activator)